MAEKAVLSDELSEAVGERNSAEAQWKAERNRLEVELKQATEKLHVQDITRTMNQTEAFRTMMREKVRLFSFNISYSSDIIK